MSDIFLTELSAFIHAKLLISEIYLEKARVDSMVCYDDQDWLLNVKSFKCQHLEPLVLRSCLH